MRRASSGCFDASSTRSTDVSFPADQSIEALPPHYFISSRDLLRTESCTRGSDFDALGTSDQGLGEAVPVQWSVNNAKAGNRRFSRAMATQDAVADLVEAAANSDQFGDVLLWWLQKCEYDQSLDALADIAIALRSSSSPHNSEITSVAAVNFLEPS